LGMAAFFLLMGHVLKYMSLWAILAGYISNCQEKFCGLSADKTNTLWSDVSCSFTTD
jgi:hypothetical protein